VRSLVIKVPAVEIGPGTRVLVTGASRGIGEAIVRAFAARGATLGLVARRQEPLEQLAGELPGSGHMALSGDVADPDSIAAAVERFGDVDVLVANAGITHYRPFAQLPLDEARRMNDVNWLGTIHTVWSALPRMIERGRGHIVVVSSGGGVRGFPSAAVYNGTKAAQRGFAEALRHELHGTGVSVTTVFPGEVETSLHDHELDHMPDWYRLDRRAPAGPLGEQVVDAVERDRRELFYPPAVRMLRVVNGISPRLGDLVLRRILGRSVAPR
jgi:short-subunit dehydrogenase